MPIRKVETVRKRDGRVVPYDEQKIAEAIVRAARAAGHDNATIGRDLASVVTMYLERYRERDIPTSEEIQRLVEKILFDTGHAAVARAYIVYRERKGQPAGAAAPPAEDLFPTNLVLVDGATRAEVAPWGRDRIIAALTKEAGLEEAAAAEIAGAVEGKIFQLGQRRVSTTLIRELVNHEPRPNPQAPSPSPPRARGASPSTPSPSTCSWAASWATRRPGSTPTGCAA